MTTASSSRRERTIPCTPHSPECLNRWQASSSETEQEMLEGSLLFMTQLQIRMGRRGGSDCCCAYRPPGRATMLTVVC